jgi:HAD superfamily hydrolase (TIGR01484 family)
VRYVCLASDYDGTLASQGSVPGRVVEALERVRESGRTTVLVTGRELDDLERAFDRLDLFDRVVAENGAVLLDPSTKETRVLAEGPPEAFVRALRERGVEPLSVGRVIVATREPHQQAVLDAIHDLGLEHQVIFNKGAVMVLPAGVNKASGLGAALEELRLSPHNVVGIGDAENDHAFLQLCELAVAVANALASIEERSDFVTRGDDGDGVVELIEALLEDDLAGLDDRLGRHDLPIGHRDDRPVTLRPHRTNVLITGPSGSGKSTLTTGIVERLREHSYQFLLVDPEGDYDALEGVTVLGAPDRAPTVEEALDVLADPSASLVLDLLGIRLDDRPRFLEKLLPRIQELRTRTGRPHWLVVDEAHHLLPSGLKTTEEAMARDVTSLVLVTVHADAMAKEALEPINVVITPAEGAVESLESFAETAGMSPPETDSLDPGKEQAVIWFVDDRPFAFDPLPPAQDLKRHRRKYAEGDLEEDAFFFVGPEGKLNLRVQNLILFAQIAEGLDDETWTWHLERGDYERWFREAIDDQKLAAVAKEAAEEPDPKASRERILRAIQERYTAPAEAG